MPSPPHMVVYTDCVEVVSLLLSEEIFNILDIDAVCCVRMCVGALHHLYVCCPHPDMIVCVGALT